MNLQAIQAHNEAVRGICVSPTDLKFATASDDSTLKVITVLLACIGNASSSSCMLTNTGRFRMALEALHFLMGTSQRTHLKR